MHVLKLFACRTKYCIYILIESQVLNDWSGVQIFHIAKCLFPLEPWTPVLTWAQALYRVLCILLKCPEWFQFLQNDCLCLDCLIRHLVSLSIDYFLQRPWWGVCEYTGHHLTSVYQHSKAINKHQVGSFVEAINFMGSYSLDYSTVRRSPCMITLAYM